MEVDGSETLQERLETLKTLNRGRFDYVLARSDSSDVLEALGKCGRSKSWYYKFTEEERAQLEALADELHYSKAVQAQQILMENVRAAAEQVVRLMYGDDRRTSLAAAKEVLDRALGKPAETVNHSGKINLQWTSHRPPTTGSS